MADRLEATGRSTLVAAAVLSRIRRALLALLWCVLTLLAVVLARRTVLAIGLLLLILGLRRGCRHYACVDEQGGDSGAGLQQGQQDDDVERPANADAFRRVHE